VHGGHYDWQRDGKTVREEGYATHLQAKEAVRVLEKRDARRPLFMFLSLGAPHLPNEAPPQAIAAYGHIDDMRRRVHAAMVSELDAAIGQVLSTLDSQNMRHNTVVWFMSDNGGITDYRGMPKAFYRLVDAAKWAFDDDIPIRFLEFMRSNVEDGGSDNAPLRGSKGSVLEGGIRVPALVSMPGTLTPGRFTTRFSIIDMLPTLLDLAGAPAVVSQPQDGRSYWPALTGQTALPDAPFMTQAFNGNSAVFHAQYKLLVKGDGSLALYDVIADPSEMRDLAAQHPDIVARLQTRLKAMPKGKNLAMPLWRLAIDPDEFGGVERKPPLAEYYAE
jgi:arylsulfatase A-like enzyme